MEEAKKKVYMLGAFGSRAEAIIQFLKNRDWEVDAGSDIMSALSDIMAMKPDFILLDVQLKHPKVRVLPAILTQTVNAVVIPYAEVDNISSQKMLKSFNLPYTVPAPASGPSVERILLKFERDREREKQEAERKKNGDGKNSWNDASQSDQRIAIRGGSNQSDEIHINGSRGGSQAVHIHGERAPGDDSTTEEAHRSLPNFYNPQEGQDPSLDQASIMGGAGSSDESSQILQNAHADHRGEEAQSPSEDSQGPVLDPKQLAKSSSILPDPNPSAVGSFIPTSQAEDQNSGQESSAQAESSAALSRDKGQGSSEGDSPDDLLGEAELAALGALPLQQSVEDSLLQRGVQFALDSAADPAAQPISAETAGAKTKLQVLSIKTKQSSGYILLCPTQLSRIDATFVEEFRGQLEGYLKMYGDDPEEMMAVELTTQSVDFLGWSQECGEFIEQVDHAGDQLVLSYFVKEDAGSEHLEQAEASEHAQLLKLDLHEIDESIPLDFSVFIHLPRNQKLLRFGKEQRFISQKQIDRFRKSDVSHVLVQKSEEQQVRLYRLRVFLNASITSYLESFQQSEDTQNEDESVVVKAS